MDKLQKVVVTTLVIHSFAAHLVMIGQQEEIRKLRDVNRKQAHWMRLMSEIVMTHVKMGGEIRTTDGLSGNLDAYLIFRDNDML